MNFFCPNDENVNNETTTNFQEKKKKQFCDFFNKVK